MAKTREKQQERETQTVAPHEVGTMTVPSVPPPPKALAVIPATEAQAAFADEIKDKQREEPAHIPIISIMHREAKFVLPSGEMTDTVSGYPVYYFQTRRYYEKPPVPGQSKGSPPDCWSADMVRPHHTSTDKQCETCLECEKSKWESGRDGRSQACATHTWVVLINPEFGSPPLAALTAPPSSIRALVGTKFEPGYFARARAKHRFYQIVWTTFGLRQQGDQVVYCSLDPIMGPVCEDPEMTRQIGKIRNDWLGAMDNLRGMMPAIEASET